jgi:exosome complex exonuclease DIS3/RRP44
LGSLGIEGVIKFKQDFSFDADNYSLTLPSSKGGTVTLNVFEKVRVGIAVEKDKNTLRGKVVMSLARPSVNCQ